jgi:hypothetical protein
LLEKAQRIAASRSAKDSREASAARDWAIVVTDDDEEVQLDIRKVAADAFMQAGRDDLAAFIKNLNAPVAPQASAAPEAPTPSPINESAKPGPGKVFQAPEEYVQERGECDKIQTKKKNLENGWKKYSEKNKEVKNGEEPEGFSISMG